MTLRQVIACRLHMSRREVEVLPLRNQRSQLLHSNLRARVTTCEIPANRQMAFTSAYLKASNFTSSSILTFFIKSFLYKMFLF